MPRAFDKYPTQRGLGGDSLYSPTRGGLPWQNPLEAISSTATDTVTAIGQVIRDWLALDQLEAAFAEFAAAFIDLDWLSPDAIRAAIAAAGKLLAAIGAWAVQVIENLTRLDLSGETGFVRDLIELLAFDALHTAWETFLTGWSALNWANPVAAIHPAWMLAVDFGRDLSDWALQALQNLTGISLPGFLALDELRGHWDAFSTAWGSINWGNPLTGIHTAWMAAVDLLWNIVAWAQTVLRNLTGIEVPNFFDTDTITGLWQSFTGAWSAIAWTGLSAVWSAITAVGSLVRGAVHWAIGVVRNLTGIDLEPIAASFGLDDLAAALTTWADTLAGINWLSAGGLMAAVGAFITLAQALGNWALGVIEAWLGWNTSIVHGAFESFGNLVGTMVEFFWGADGLAAWTGALDAIGGVGATILDAIKAAHAGLTELATMIGQFTTLSGLVDFVSGILGENGLLGWLASLPFIGPLVSVLTGETPVGNTALDLSTLGTWANGLLTGRSAIPAENLFGSIPQALLGMIPVSAISFGGQNLLAQGNFNNAETVEPGDGIGWDGAYSATGTGGSMRFTGTGSLQRRNSRQVIKVASGDRVTVSALVKTSGFTAAAGRQAVLLVVPWIGQTAQSEHVVATRTTAASGTAQTMSGSTIRIGGTAGPGEVALSSSITALTVCVTVVANSGAQVWMDNVTAAKTGNLAQTWVDSLVDGWNQLIGGLTNPAAGAGGTTGKTWADLFVGASAFRSLFNTDTANFGTLKLNLFGNANTVGTTLQDGAIPNIGLSKSTPMQAIVNNIFRGLFGDAPVDMSTDDVLTAAQQTAKNVATVKTAVADLQAKAANGAFSGVAQAVDISTYADGSIPSSAFSVNHSVWTGSPAGSGEFRIRAGRAAYVTSGLDNRRSVAVHTTATATAWQRVGVVLATQSSSYQSVTAAVLLGARLNSTGTVGVYAKLNAGSAVQIVDGSGNVLHTGSLPAPSAGTYWLEVGVGAADKRVRVWWESFCLLDQTFGSLPNGGQYTGCGVEARTYSRGGGTYTALPGEIAAFTMHDNKPADQIGSGFRASRGATVAAVSTATGGAVLPASFFAEEIRTSDYTWDATNNRVTVSVTGWYLVTVALHRDDTDTTKTHAAAIYKNGALHAVGNRHFGGGFISGATSGTRSSSIVAIPVYLAAGDNVQAAYLATNGVNLIGSAGGVETYFAVAFLNNTKPVQPVAA